MRSLLSPLFLFPAFYLFYIVLATLGFFFSKEYLFKPKGYFDGVSPLSYLISFLFIAFFVFGYKIGEKMNLEKKNVKKIVLAAIFFVSLFTLNIANKPLYLSLIFIIILIFISKLNIKQTTYLTTTLAFFVFALTVARNGLPFFHREEYIADLNRAAFLVLASMSAAFSIVYFEKIIAFPIIFLLSAMGLAFGFKGDAISVLASSAVSGIFSGKIKKNDIIFYILAVLLVVSIFGTIIAIKTYSTWKLSPLEYLFYRPAFTFLVFNEIVKLSFPFGHLGKDALLLLKFDIVSTEVLGYSNPVSITATIIGNLMLAYGVPIVILFSFILGIYLSQMFKVRDNYDICLYSLAIVHTLLLIEIGTPFSSFLYYLSLFYLKLRKL